MCLNIYTDKSKIPSNITLIDDNETFFDGFTLLKDCEFVKAVLHNVEKAEYINTECFLGRIKDIGSLNKSCLSTGTKTIINLYSNPKGYCFNLCECGNNVLQFLPQVTEGHVLFEIPVIALDSFEDESCDIMFEGTHYTNIYDFLEAAYGA